MITVYGYSNSGNCHKLRLLLTQLGREFRWVEVDSTGGQTRTAEYLAKNPNGKVPMIEAEDGRVMTESNAILCWLAEGTAFWAGDAWQRAQGLSWMFFEQYSHEPYVATPRYICRHFPADHPRRAELHDRLAKGRAAFAVMEQHLSTRQFFVNDRYSIADIALFAYSHVAEDGGHNLEAFPNLREWLGRIAAQPGYVPLLARPQ